MIYKKDNNGDTVLHGNAKVEFYDFRLEEARDLYVKGIELYPVCVLNLSHLAVLDPVRATAGGANGVFIDGTVYRTLLNCHYKTCGQDRAQCCVFSEAADQEYNEGLKLVKTTKCKRTMLSVIFSFRHFYHLDNKTRRLIQITL